MLDLIVKTSSDQESIVLDCFCGSGTTLKSAQTHGRTWIGIDSSDHAIRAARVKLAAMHEDLFMPKPEYEYLDLTGKD